jgi:predicted RNase H-like HicB family nuclease
MSNETVRTRTYQVIFEKSETGWGAYAPDLPGLGVAAKTREEAERLIREGIIFHIEGLIEDGLPVPEPSVWCQEIEVSA